MKRWLIITSMIIAVVVVGLYNHRERVHHRMDIALKTFMNADVEYPDQYLLGIDYSKPVVFTQLSPGDKVIQYQIPGAPQGNFYGMEGSLPTELGISDKGWDKKRGKSVKKEKRIYKVTQFMTVLSSYSKAMVDNWSTPWDETQTEGTKIQLFSTCKPCFERIN